MSFFSAITRFANLLLNNFCNFITRIARSAETFGQLLYDTCSAATALTDVRTVSWSLVVVYGHLGYE